MKSIWFGVIALLAACASAKSDAPRPSHDVVSGAGRIHGGGVRMDVAIGHAISREPVKSMAATAQPTTPVAP